ncbi:MAG TPA: hypothetical protein VFB73_00980 [Chloroflexota bacterium]|nr:hypothetical protein [Chloroflexota bacterium]
MSPLHSRHRIWSAVIGGLLGLSGLALPGTALAQASYGGGPGVPTSPPQITIALPGSFGSSSSGNFSLIPTAPLTFHVPTIAPPLLTSRAAPEAVVPPAPPVAASAPPVAAPAPSAPVAAPPPVAPPVAEAPARVVAAPPPVQPAPLAVAPEALAVVAPPPPVEEVVPRSIALSSAPLTVAPPSPAFRPAPGPGLSLARVLPKAGEGPAAAAGLWPPLALALVAIGLAAVGLVWPLRRPRRRA